MALATGRSSRVSSLSLVRYCTNDYSVPVAYGHREVQGRGYVGQVVISCGAELRIVQDLMGRVSVATTQVYTHITKPEARKAYLQFHQLAKGFRSAQRRIDEGMPGVLNRLRRPALRRPPSDKSLYRHRAALAPVDPHDFANRRFRPVDPVHSL